MTPDGPSDLEHSLGSGHRAGSTIGPYHVLGVLGAGSFGVVYRVCRAPSETLALKLLIATDAEDAHRFAREIEIARRLDHPGLVRIVDAGRQGNFPYYVMEYCPGETLAARLGRGPFDIESAVRLVTELARTTAAVNAEGVIHRDLKPSNVILGPEGPRITDFGLAHDARARERLTRTGDAMGTPAYMAPELFTDAKRADQRADVYALGVILYQCLTGACPFRGALNEVAQRVVAGRFAAPRALRPEIPDALEAVVLQAMSSDPLGRYATADVLVEELERVLTAPPGGKTSSPRLVAALVGTSAVAAALVIGIAVALVRRSGDRSQPVVASSPAPRAAPAAPDPAAPDLPTPTPTSPPAPTPDRAAARATLAEARRLDAELAPPERVLALLSRARTEAAGDPRLEAAALRAELDLLYSRGRVQALRSRRAALAGSAVDRYARWLAARTYPNDASERRDSLQELARGHDALAALAAGVLAAARPAQAEPLLRRALRMDPELTSARVYLALSAARRGRHAEAHRLLDEALRHAPNDPQALWARVQLLQFQRRSRDAVRPLDRLAALRDPQAPDRYDVLYQRARMSLHLNRLREGLPFLDQALQVRPLDTVAYLLRGVIRMRLNERERAAADFRSAALARGKAVFERELRRRYRTPQLQAAIWALTLQGLRTVTIALTPQGRSRLRAHAAPSPAAVRPQVERLLLEAARGARWEALEAGWASVRAAAPRSGWVALLHAEALLSRGWITKAAEVLRATNSMNQSGQRLLFKYRLLADASRHAGNIAHAVKAWRILVRLDADGSEGRLAQAFLRGFPTDVDRCVPALQAAIARDGDHAPAIVALTTIQAARGDDPIAAIANAESLLKGGLHSVEVIGARFQALARLLRARGRWEWIRSDAKALLAFAPHSSYLGRAVWWVLRSSPHASDRAKAEAIRAKLPFPPREKQ